MRIALVEDDIDQANILTAWLTSEGFAVTHYSEGKEFTRSLRAESFDLVILDWMLPDTNGINVLAWVRDNIEWHLPIIFVTSRDTEEDVVSALDTGADDYITKPVQHRVLLARTKALLRRAYQQDQEDVLDLSPYYIDKTNHSITVNDSVLDLTQKEYDLALFLFKNEGKILSRGHILEEVWGTMPDLNTRTVDTHISRIRKKLDLKTQNGWILNSIYQTGYRLENVSER